MHFDDKGHAVSDLEWVDRKKQFARILKMIYLADKTEYNYYGKKAANRFGELPKTKGSRWKTPAEIAQLELVLLGYSDPSEVKEDSQEYEVTKRKLKLSVRAEE